jgi:hypothetical protein
MSKPPLEFNLTRVLKRHAEKLWHQLNKNRNKNVKEEKDL